MRLSDIKSLRSEENFGRYRIVHANFRECIPSSKSEMISKISKKRLEFSSRLQKLKIHENSELEKPELWVWLNMVFCSREQKWITASRANKEQCLQINTECED